MRAAGDSIEMAGLSCRRVGGAGEAALLFAAGHVAAARACLDEVLERNVSDPRAWTLLFDLHRVLHERERFDAMLAAYREVFPQAPVPAWESPAIPSGSAAIALHGVLACPADLRPLQSLHGARIVAIDCGRLERLDFALAPMFCSTLRQAVAAGKRIILANVCDLHEALLAEVGLPAGLTLLPRRAAATASLALAA